MTRLLLAATLTLLLPGAAVASMAVPAPTTPTNAPACQSPDQPVHEARFIRIGGIEQWVTIDGARCANPVVLFVHGGPGNPLTPYAAKVYGAWEKDFTLVHWDQRGAGKTFSRNPDTADATLTMELMAADGVELAAAVAKHLRKDKLILLGGSWGSALGAHMVKSRPGLFSAFVAAGQLVSYRLNEIASYDATLALARTAKDEKTVAALEALGPPPWVNPRNFGILRRATRGYEAKATVAAPKHWWEVAPEYSTPEMQAAYEAGEEYSYLQFVGMKGDGMLSRLDLPSLGARFELPVFMIMGAEDLVTTPGVAKAYFDSIEAPRKEYILLPAVGHDPNQAMVDAEYAVLKSIAGPATK